MHLPLNNMKKKIVVLFLTLLICFIFYLSVFPTIVVKNIDVKQNIPIKVLPYKDYLNNKNDSLLIYIPYKIQITNYSSLILKRPNFYFREINSEHNPQFMIYDNDGKNIYDLSNDNLSVDDVNEMGKLFPLIPKSYYIYKYNIIPSSKLKILLDSTSYKKIIKEFISSKYNLSKKNSLIVPKKIIDSLYKIEDNKPFYINFLSKPLWKVKLVPSKKDSEFENLYKLTKEQAYEKLSHKIE